MKSVLVTGSSRGIGRETALLFARHGYRTALMSFLRSNMKSHLLASHVFLFRQMSGTMRMPRA